MLHELFSGFELELGVLAGKVDEAREAIDHCETREATAVARQQLAAVEDLLADISRARNSILSAERRATERVEKFIRWRGLLSQCAELKKTVESLSRDVEPARSVADIAQQQFDAAANRLAEHNQHLLRDADYPTSKELAAERDRSEALQRAVDKAKVNRDVASQAAHDAEGRARVAAREFDKACFDERMARLPQPQKEQGIGQLSAVR